MKFYDLCAFEKNIYYLLNQTTQVQGKVQPITGDSDYLAHQLPGGKLLLSPHGKWLASCGTDGAVQIRAAGTLVSLNF